MIHKTSVCKLAGIQDARIRQVMTAWEQAQLQASPEREPAWHSFVTRECPFYNIFITTITSRNSLRPRINLTGFWIVGLDARSDPRASTTCIHDRRSPRLPLQCVFCSDTAHPFP